VPHVKGSDVPGFISETRFCPICRTAEVYHDKYDAFFCPHCNTWAEERCSDPTCSYCTIRPSLPLQLP